MMHLISAECVNFYDNLNSANGITEYIDDFNVERLDVYVDETEIEIAK